MNNKIQNGMKTSQTFDDLYEAFVTSHQSQLKNLGITENKWKTLLVKLNNSVFDAGDYFIYVQEESDDSENEESQPLSQSQLKIYTKCLMEPDDEDSIFLIDHAWTYTLDNAQNTLLANANLLERMCTIMNIQFSTESNVDLTDKLMKEMWKFNNSYIWQNSNQDGSFTRCYFIMDEFGSCIHRSMEPTFSVVPFFFGGDKIMYSLLFPIVKVSRQEEVTYGYPKFSTSLPDTLQSALKFPWEKCDLSHIKFSQSEPDVDYFSSGRLPLVLPDSVSETVPLMKRQKVKVYTQYPEVFEHVTSTRFVFTENKGEANILWLAERVSDYKSLCESRGDVVYVNQYPSEQVLTNKDLLAFVCRGACPGSSVEMCTLDTKPRWLPTTYSMMSELPQFVSYFQNREKRNLDNVWICKPTNLARGIDIYITDNLSQIIRLNEMRPMVACKYITDPVLFLKENVGLVKMDLRFIVLLRSIQDLQLFVYERFWIRFANKPFSLDNFDDYEKHFTVMNYCDFPLQEMFCHDFIEQFEDFYESYKWTDIQDQIHAMIKDVFVAAAQKDPPSGLGHYPGSRAMYGLDIMLEWDRHHDNPLIRPVLLEVNWMPDCKRACQYYPEYYDDVFSALFLNQTEGRHFVQL